MVKLNEIDLNKNVEINLSVITRAALYRIKDSAHFLKSDYSKKAEKTQELDNHNKAKLRNQNILHILEKVISATDNLTGKNFDEEIPTTLVLEKLGIAITDITNITKSFNNIYASINAYDEKILESGGSMNHLDYKDSIPFKESRKFLRDELEEISVKYFGGKANLQAIIKNIPPSHISM